MTARLPALTLFGALSVTACGTDEDILKKDSIPASSGVVTPLDLAALQSGNRAFGCASDDLEAKVGALLARMTLAQKIAEMHGAALTTKDGLWRAGGDDALGIPSFTMTDGPRGVRVGKASAFPVGMARGATWDPELERRVGLAIGLETAAKGGNVLLAPTMNLLYHPGWGRAQETYSEDSFHMGLMALAFVGGVQNHVLASAKHFAVNDIEDSRFTVSANLSERTLHEVYLPHFRRVVTEAKVASVMSAYNRVNGVYCAENPELLSDTLKGAWGFTGFVESDWVLGTRSTAPSLRAGLDIEMPGALYYGPALADAVAAGDIDERAIDEAVRRILRQKLCFGLEAPAAIDPNVVESAEHAALAREVAEKSIVLLKNDAHSLPLAADTQKIAIVGALADVANLGDRGSSSVTPTQAVSPYAGIRARVADGELVLIASDEPSESDLANIAAADVAIVVAGLTYQDEGEFIPAAQESEGFATGGDRTSLNLPAAKERLIRTVAARAKRTVVVLEGGSAIVVEPWIDSVSALVMAWYPGMQGGAALAGVLFGDTNPSGKLPVTFARSLDQLPAWDVHADEVAYDVLHGYRRLDASGAEPRYAFGFGLSYTSFALGRLQLDRTLASAADVVRVSVDVYNSGARAGAEVVQLYVSYRGSAVDRAPKDLRGFRRVELEPGQVQTVQFELPVSELAYYDERTHGFAVEPLEYVLHAGTSSRDLPLSAVLRVQ